MIYFPQYIKNLNIYGPHRLKKIPTTGPNLYLLCVWQSDTVTFCENYAKLYFYAKCLEKGLDRRC